MESAWAATSQLEIRNTHCIDNDRNKMQEHQTRTYENRMESSSAFCQNVNVDIMNTVILILWTFNDWRPLTRGLHVNIESWTRLRFITAPDAT